MDNSNKIIPPHLNAEVYRTNTTGTDTLSYLDYIYVHPDKSILVGSSELTGRYWNGAASIFKCVTDAQKLLRTAKKDVQLFSGTNDGCFVDKSSSSKVLLCEDSGSVSIWSNTDDAWKQWSETKAAAEHDAAAVAVDCLEPGNKYVTVGADGNAKVWDINEMICVKSYLAAHSRGIFDVSAKPNCSTNFITAACDQYLSLWDDNTEKSVFDIVNNCGIRCVQWLNDNEVLYGDEAGVLRLFDIRNIDNVATLHEFPAALHRICIHPQTKKVAVCGDNRIVTVVKLKADSSSEVLYSDKRHSNYVRGLAWDVSSNNVLHSSGWDGQIYTHIVESH